MDSIGIGLIGTGFMGKCHALAFNAVKATMGDVPRPRLTVLCDVDAAHTAQKASDFGFARHTTDWRAVIADPEVDLVSITTPNAQHREMAIAALEAGKHVYCEKPMALTLADAEAMAAAARKARGRTRLGYNYTVNPAIQHARRLVHEGAIGRLLHVRGQVDEDYMADPDLPWSWRCRAADAGLGTLGDITCHLVSLLHGLVGRITSLSADIAVAYPQRPMKDEPGKFGTVENEDIAQALVRFENGVTGVLSSSRAAHGRKSLIRIELHGSHGMITFDQERMNELELYVAEGDAATRGFRTILTGPAHPPYGQFCPAPGHQLGFNELKVIEAAEFLRAIAAHTPIAFDFEEGLAVERVIHGFVRSAEERRWVDL
ncbi:Gfo/Idh/MocA family oxidoreductase [Chelatococcus sp. SYSU_G07232]|uniref:Gfo/Idh/MocA family oxidoreductase n=2 Tax=Chelatococcus albus TaxID=3047466 RepID=A0ABT7AH18_9HYPH|nr:Gfo/Idh/MocA family oxidoreductase [Chelatococcus sp. SYSU_G07232]MDJ1158653.1 Gfo/Idh/MocA family oxidoreductase [Chelatococcus sp. SYSU_G07232]